MQTSALIQWVKVFAAQTDPPGTKAKVEERKDSKAAL